MTLVFVLGIVIVSIGQLYVWTAKLNNGDTFHVSFNGIFNGTTQNIVLRFSAPGQVPKTIVLGCVSAYTIYAFAPENVGTYYFMDKRDYDNGGEFKYNVIEVRAEIVRGKVCLIY